MQKQKPVIKQSIKLRQKFQACLVLSAVGDAMGYKNGDWEFNTSSKIIHQQMMKLTNGKGPLNLQINLSWKYSDDTVMHIATAQALIASKKNIHNINQVARNIAIQYKKCANKMSGRAPGRTCMKSIQILKENGQNWDKIPYNDRAGGCGGSMRSACIGLQFYKQQYLYDLIKVSIQAGRITHHNPIGYLGSMVSSYFTSLAIREIKPQLWAKYLLKQAFPLCQKYIKEAGRQVDFNIKGSNWNKFVQGWKKYGKTRNLISDAQEQVKVYFPQKYDIIDRQHFYRQISFGSWPGATGFDSVLIAYDAILGCNQSWEQFCLRGILHGGDNDSTGAIGGAWFGALYGFKGVPKRHYQSLEDGKKLKCLGDVIYQNSEF